MTMGSPEPAFERAAIAGPVFIFAGTTLILQSYQIFIPLKKPMPETNTCPYCGALLEEDSTYCKKCKNKLD